MAELPQHPRDAPRARMLPVGVRNWLERDLNDTRPLSTVLAMLPLLPGIVAGKAGASDELTTVLLALGGIAAIAWVGYVFTRSFANALRTTRRVFSDAEARERGKAGHLPIETKRVLAP